MAEKKEKWELNLSDVSIIFHPQWQRGAHFKGFLGSSEMKLKHFPKLLQRWLLYIIRKAVMECMYPEES